MRTTVAVLAAFMAACGSEPPCKLDDNTPYQLDSTELSGDCGELGSGLQTTGEADRRGCSTQMLPGDDAACTWRFRRLCVDRTGLMLELLAAYTRQDDDATWKGRLDVTLRDASGVVECSSLYSVTLTEP